MPGQSWQETLINQNVDGTALTGSVTPTSILHATAKLQLPPNFWRIGKMIKIAAAGRVSNIVTTPGTLTLDIRMGPAAPPTIVVANGGAMSLNIVAKTNVPWYLEWVLTCRAVGNTTAANLMHQGVWTSESVIGAGVPTATGAGSHLLPNAAPAVGTGFDSTVGLFIDLFATWSLSNANSIQTHMFRIEDLNPSW
jgi:hypothetical protein